MSLQRSAVTSTKSQPENPVPDSRQYEAHPVAHWIESGRWPRGYTDSKPLRSDALRNALAEIVEREFPAEKTNGSSKKSESLVETTRRLEKQNEKLEKAIKLLWSRNATAEERTQAGRDPSAVTILQNLLGEEYDHIIAAAFYEET